MKKLFLLFIFPFLSCSEDDIIRQFNYSEDNFYDDKVLVLSNECLETEAKLMYLKLIDSIFWLNQEYQNMKFENTMVCIEYDAHIKKWSRNAVNTFLQKSYESKGSVILYLKDDYLLIDLSFGNETCPKINKIFLNRYILYEILRERNREYREIIENNNSLYQVI